MMNLPVVLCISLFLRAPQGEAAFSKKAENLTTASSTTEPFTTVSTSGLHRLPETSNPKQPLPVDATLMEVVPSIFDPLSLKYWAEIFHDRDDVQHGNKEREVFPPPLFNNFHRQHTTFQVALSHAMTTLFQSPLEVTMNDTVVSCPKGYTLTTDPGWKCRRVHYATPIHSCPPDFILVADIHNSTFLCHRMVGSPTWGCPPGATEAPATKTCRSIHMRPAEPDPRCAHGKLDCVYTHRPHLTLEKFVKCPKGARLVNGNQCEAESTVDATMRLLCPEGSKLFRSMCHIDNCPHGSYFQRRRLRGEPLDELKVKNNLQRKTNSLREALEKHSWNAVRRAKTPSVTQLRRLTDLSNRRSRFRTPPSTFEEYSDQTKVNREFQLLLDEVLAESASPSKAPPSLGQWLVVPDKLRRDVVRMSKRLDTNEIPRRKGKPNCSDTWILPLRKPSCPPEYHPLKDNPNVCTKKITIPAHVDCSRASVAERSLEAIETQSLLPSQSSPHSTEATNALIIKEEEEGNILDVIRLSDLHGAPPRSITKADKRMNDTRLCPLSLSQHGAQTLSCPSGYTLKKESSQEDPFCITVKETAMEPHCPRPSFLYGSTCVERLLPSLICSQGVLETKRLNDAGTTQHCVYEEEASPILHVTLSCSRPECF